MAKLIHKLILFLLDALFPKKCLSCDARGKYICPACFEKIFEPESRSLAPLKTAISAGSYANPVFKRILRKFKYGRVRALKDELADLMLKASKLYISADAQIMAIPMAIQRRWERGFNQAELLAKAFASQTALPYAAGLIKIKPTKPQAEIKNREERLKNIKGVFGVAAGFKPSQKIILIDDIRTTGATLREAARVLKKSGAKEIIGITVAR